MKADPTEPIPRADDVDHAWLSRNLGWSLRGDETIATRSISHTESPMGDVHRISCAGRSVIIKGPPKDSSTLGDLVARTGLVMREIQSYRLLGEMLLPDQRVTPECYWSALGSDGQGALALEDLGTPTPLGRAMAAGLSRAQAQAAVRSLATVHATMAELDADSLSPPRPWLFSAASEDLLTWIRIGIEELPALLSALWPGRPSVPGLQRIVETDVRALLARSHRDANCVSLCHGDAWAGNILIRAQPEDDLHRPIAHLIDWQFTMWGNPLSDVALLLVSSLDPQSRAAWSEDLLRCYHSTLTAHCSLRYSLEACRDDLRRAEPAAALGALATIEAYTQGMDQADLSDFAARVSAAADLVLTSLDRGQ